MLERFLKSFELDDTNGRSLKSLPSDAAITKSLEGLSFNDGLYRVHSQLDLSKWSEITTRVFNQYVGRISCFGYDWLGRQFAIDHADCEGKKLQVLMFEVGRGKVYQIPADIFGFHDDILGSVPIAPVTAALIHLTAEVDHGKAVLVERCAVGSH